MQSFNEIYESLLIEGQLKPREEEQEAYDRLVVINDAAGKRDFTDALLQWYRTELKNSKEDISFDKTNHIRDTLAILNKNLSNGKLKPKTEVTVETPRGPMKKDISNPRDFMKFDVYDTALNAYLNQQTAEEGEKVVTADVTKLDIKLFKATPDLVVWATTGYDDTLAFIRILWPKMQGTSNLGAYGSSAYSDDLCPYCTSGKSHWKSYSAGKNYTQYWFLKNVGKNLKDYYGKGKATLYAMLDSDGDLLNKHDVAFSKYAQHPYPSFVSLVKEIYELHKKQMDKEKDSVFIVLNAPTPEQIKDMIAKFWLNIKKKTDANGKYAGTITIPEYIHSLVGCPKEVGGDFDCSHIELTSLEGAPQKVAGEFICSDNILTSLEGAPYKVSLDFRCSGNQLITLKGAPNEVGGAFVCSENQLTTLEYSPKKVGKSFRCSNNKLTTLKGAPSHINGNFSCHFNQLKTLEHSPQNISADFTCSDNLLTSLESGPITVGGDFTCQRNKLTTLSGIAYKVGGEFNFDGNPTAFSDTDIKSAQLASKQKNKSSKINERLSFKTFFTEMPYIDVHADEKYDADIIDLEFETLKGKSLADLKARLKRLFSGEEFKDKYGNIIHIKTPGAKAALKASISNNQMSLLMLKRFFGLNKVQVKLLLKSF